MVGFGHAGIEALVSAIRVIVSQLFYVTQLFLSQSVSYLVS